MVTNELKEKIIVDLISYHNVKPFYHFSKRILHILFQSYFYVVFSELFYDSCLHEDDEDVESESDINYFFNNWIEPYEDSIWSYNHVTVRRDLKEKLYKNFFTLEDWKQRVYHKCEGDGFHTFVFLMRDIHKYDIEATFYNKDYHKF